LLGGRSLHFLLMGCLFRLFVLLFLLLLCLLRFLRLPFLFLPALGFG
jgi:hypothetical protein